MSPTTDPYPIPTRTNVAVVAVQLVAFAGIMLLAARATEWWHLALLAAAFAILGNSIYSIIHEAEHGMLLPHRFWNHAVGAGMAVLFPAPYHLIRQGHLGHHRRNRSDDEAFDLYFDGDIVWLKWLELYGILTGFYWLLVVFSNVAVLIVPFLFKRRFFEFDRPSAAFMDALEPRWFWLIQVEAIVAIAFHAMVIWLLGVPPLHYFLVYCGFGFSWSAMQYVHHYGAQRDVVEGARNLRFIGWIDRVWLNHNWHLAHHRQPTIPWIYLPQLEDSAQPRGSLVLHYLAMWRGPRYTAERVANRLETRVFQ